MLDHVYSDRACLKLPYALSEIFDAYCKSVLLFFIFFTMFYISVILPQLKKTVLSQSLQEI